MKMELSDVHSLHFLSPALRVQLHHNIDKIGSAGGTFLVVQWLRIYLQMQRPRVRLLVQEDPTCHRAIKAACRNV